MIQKKIKQKKKNKRNKVILRKNYTLMVLKLKQKKKNKINQILLKNQNLYYSRSYEKKNKIN